MNEQNDNQSHKQNSTYLVKHSESDNAVYVHNHNTAYQRNCIKYTLNYFKCRTFP